jgi:hypothetical protein
MNNEQESRLVCFENLFTPTDSVVDVQSMKISVHNLPCKMMAFIIIGPVDFLVGT